MVNEQPYSINNIIFIILFCNIDIFSVRSTSVKRTILTARGVVAGLFGKENIKGML